MSSDAGGQLVGGPFDGQRREVVGRAVIFSLVTAEYEAEYHAWFEEHGVAWTVENLEHLWENPVTPRPPDYPQAIYDWTRQGDEWVGVFRVEN